MRAAGPRLAALLLWACGAAALACGGPGAPPNLVLVTVDTLRADHLGAYGYERPTSPAIDGLAREGVVFERAFAPRGMTWPSLASIMTSRYPVAHGVRRNGIEISPAQTTLAEVLAARGWATAAIVWRNVRRQRWEGFEHVASADDDPELARLAIEWLEARPPGPFFLWLHLHRPHSPYAPPEELARRFDTGYRGPIDGSRQLLDEITFTRRELSAEELAHVVSLYDAETAYADGEVGRLLAALERLDLASDSLVVLSADHGEDLAQRQSYFYHMASVYDSSLHVPLILRWPKVLPAGARVRDLVENIDLAPTLVELMGVEAPEAFQGTSLVPLIRGRKLELGPVFAEIEDKILTVRTERYRYVMNPGGHHPTWRRGPLGEDERGKLAIAEEELYDLEVDPAEQHNVVSERPELRDQLRALLLAWQEHYDWKLDGQPPVEIDPTTRRELEELGYVF